MASVESTRQRYIEQRSLLGQAALHALFPKDFEAYYLAIELVDSQGATVDYFAWPVLPDEISETQSEITTIRKTMGGVNVIKNPSFTPYQISLRGTFGRNFKAILGQNYVEFAGFGISMQGGKFSTKSPHLLEDLYPQFSTFAKTGYGCIKMLESIRDKSKQLDSYQRPFSVYFYNPILGNNYQVEFVSMKPMQDSHTYNMVPCYNIQLTAIAPLDVIIGRKAAIGSALKNLTVSNLQKLGSQITGSIRKVV